MPSNVSVENMKKEEMNNLVNILNELKKDYKETAEILKSDVKGVSQSIDLKQLFRAKNKPGLIKIGLALIAFPDPTISDILGSAFIAAGLLQAKIKCSALYVEDVYKTFPKVMKNIEETKQKLINCV